MRAFMVSVNYADLLAITLPVNRHHFEQVTVITDLTDEATCNVAYANKANVFQTDAFYRDGAIFNKWLALEEGLSAFGRAGWICLMDADILWPKEIKWDVAQTSERFCLRSGFLYTPHRRMWREWPNSWNPQGRPLQAGSSGCYQGSSMPPEHLWDRFPLHPGKEFAGWTQIFHAQDPHLPKPPWHETNFTHAGCADSFFQRLWPTECKIRPPFEVLHLGEAGVNWCGRATTLADGTTPPNAQVKRNQVRAFIRSRRHGTPDPYRGEKI